MKNWIGNTKKRFKNEKGLTLVELLAVVVILAIIGTIAFVMIGNVIENSKKDAHISNAQQLISAAKLHDAQGGEFGEGEAATNTITSGQLHDKGLIDELINPWESNATDYTGTVTKVPSSTEDSDGVTYTVTMNGSSINCGISGASEAELAEGRGEVCS